VIDRVFAVMALCPQHRFQVLTKRSRRMKDYMSRACGRIADRIMELRRKIGMPPSSVAPLPHVRPGAAWWPLANVWLGVSVEDQPRADERIADLFATDAVVRWLSCEPLLSDIQFDPCELISLDWIVAGGESGPGARPMHPDWARSIRDQCEAVGVPFFFKQWGDWEVALDRERDDPDWRADYTNVYVDRGKSKWLNLQGGCGFHGERFHVMRRVGKRAAGRLLDGVQHDGMPS
jgi:protein gp37